METNWILVTIVIITAILLIIFLIWRNQKDKKALTRKLIEEEDATIPKEVDKDNDQMEN